MTTDTPDLTKNNIGEAAPTKDVAIPPTAGKEIINLHMDLVTKAKAMEEARSAFNGFIRAVRMTVGITEGEPWEILGDASAFRKVTPPPAPVPPVPPVEPPAPGTPNQ